MRKQRKNVRNEQERERQSFRSNSGSGVFRMFGILIVGTVGIEEVVNEWQLIPDGRCRRLQDLNWIGSDITYQISSLFQQDRQLDRFKLVLLIVFFLHLLFIGVFFDLLLIDVLLEWLPVRA